MEATTVGQRMVCLIAWIECCCTCHPPWDADVSKGHDLNPALCLKLHTPFIRVDVHCNRCTRVPEQVHRHAPDLHTIKRLMLLPLIQSSQQYMTSAIAHTQSNGMPTTAPPLHKFVRQPGPFAKRCSCPTLCSQHMFRANSAISKAHVHQIQALPTQHVPHRVSAIAIMAEASERVKDKAPHSRYRADGTRRRTKGERISRAPHAAHWKERQSAEREARDRDVWEAPIQRSSQILDRQRCRAVVPPQL